MGYVREINKVNFSVKLVITCHEGIFTERVELEIHIKNFYEKIKATLLLKNI